MRPRKTKAAKRPRSKVTNSFAAVRKVVKEWQRVEARLYASLMKMIDDVERATKALRR
jgi:hypothetical protein